MDEVREGCHRPGVHEVACDRRDRFDAGVVGGAEEVVEVVARVQATPVGGEGEQEQAGEAEDFAGRGAACGGLRHLKFTESAGAGLAAAWRRRGVVAVDWRRSWDSILFG